MNFPYTDKFFSIYEINGFLPIKAPLAKFPKSYSDVQSIISDLPNLISHGDLLKKSILNLNNKIEFVK